MRKEEKELTWILSVGKTLNNQHALGKDGFTLLELILVLFLMGLMAGIVLPFVVSTLDRVKLQSEARQISSALQFARSEAITKKHYSLSMPISIKINTGSLSQKRKKSRKQKFLMKQYESRTTREQRKSYLMEHLL